MPEAILGDADLFGDRRVEAMRSGPIEVRNIHKTDADRIIREGHYSGTTAWASSLHYGVLLDNEVIGAMQFGPAMNPASGGKIVKDSTTDSWLELNRLWLADEKPPNTGSRAISCALRLIRHQCPRVEWIQSFADERCGKLGGIYQACSFLYCGAHESTFYEIDGALVHKSMLQRPGVDKRGWRAGPRVAWAQANAHCAIERKFHQYRYLKFIRPAARKRLLLPILPYPKPASGDA